MKKVLVLLGLMAGGVYLHALTEVEQRLVENFDFVSADGDTIQVDYDQILGRMALVKQQPNKSGLALVNFVAQVVDGFSDIYDEHNKRTLAQHAYLIGVMLSGSCNTEQRIATEAFYRLGQAWHAEIVSWVVYGDALEKLQGFSEEALAARRQQYGIEAFLKDLCEQRGVSGIITEFYADVPTQKEIKLAALFLLDTLLLESKGHWFEEEETVNKEGFVEPESLRRFAQNLKFAQALKEEPLARIWCSEEDIRQHVIGPEGDKPLSRLDMPWSGEELARQWKNNSDARNICYFNSLTYWFKALSKGSGSAREAFKQLHADHSLSVDPEEWEKVCRAFPNVPLSVVEEMPDMPDDEATKVRLSEICEDPVVLLRTLAIILRSAESNSSSDASDDTEVSELSDLLAQLARQGSSDHNEGGGDDESSSRVMIARIGRMPHQDGEDEEDGGCPIQ